jgi:hypothetical protein
LTHIEAIQHSDAASWNYDPTAEEYYYGFGCIIVSTGARIPIAAEFRQAKQADQEAASASRSQEFGMCINCWWVVVNITNILVE